MKKFILATVMVLTVLVLSGCGGGGSNPPPTFVTSILSDQFNNGDILKPFIPGTSIVAQGVQSVFAGIDPVTLDESRAFLQFPLATVPINAIISSAFLDIVITSIQPQPLVGTIPIRIDLVSFTQPMVGSDFDRTLQPALASMTINPPISQFDFNQHVKVNVTTLMVEAQRLGLANFQIRIMEDLGIVTPGLIEITDTTGANRAILAPLLEVTYF